MSASTVSLCTVDPGCPPHYGHYIDSVTRFFNPKKRENRVKKRLLKREKNKICAENPFKKREKLKTRNNHVLLCFY